MTQDKVNIKVAELKASGVAVEEIWRILFNTKGVRVSQVEKALGK